MSSSVKSSVTIPSDTSQGLKVQADILQALEDLNYSSRDLFCMKIGLEEAIVNAIKHGNGLDPDKSVTISWEVNQQMARVVIEDQGEGFDPYDVPDPTDLENLEKPSGRGLTLMRHYLSLVEFNPSGNRVVLEKERTIDEESAAS